MTDTTSTESTTAYCPKVARLVDVSECETCYSGGITGRTCEHTAPTGYPFPAIEQDDPAAAARGLAEHEADINARYRADLDDAALCRACPAYDTAAPAGRRCDYWAMLDANRPICARHFYPRED